MPLLVERLEQARKDAVARAEEAERERDEAQDQWLYWQGEAGEAEATIARVKALVSGPSTHEGWPLSVLVKDVQAALEGGDK